LVILRCEFAKHHEMKRDGGESELAAWIEARLIQERSKLP
jgi:hypothetical protein